MRFAEMDTFIGGRSELVKQPMTPVVCHGLGVIALRSGGYGQAQPIEACIPEPFDFDGLPKDLYRYRQFAHAPGSPATIELRLKAERQFELWERTLLNVTRGEG